MARRANCICNLNTTATILLVGLTINQNEEEEVKQDFVIDGRVAFVPLCGCQPDNTCQADAQNASVAIQRCVYYCAEVTQ